MRMGREWWVGGPSIRSVFRNVFVTGILATILSPVVFAAPAQAVYQTPISGSTYSSGTAWYLSTTWRTVSFSHGPYILLNINRAPRLSNGSSPDYMRWRINLNDSYNGPTFAINQTPSGYTDLGYYGPPNLQFRNSFGRGTTCNNCDHDFTGHMTY